MMNWSDDPTGPGRYVVANPLIDPLKPYLLGVVEADGENLAGLDAGLWATWGGGGIRLTRVEDIPVIWLGPIPLHR